MNTLIIKPQELLCSMSEFSKKFFISDELSAGETLAVFLDNERRFYSKFEYFDAETCAVSPLDRATMIEWMFRRVLCVAPK